jgi:NADPH-dependent ferric siderophore reductase
VAFGQYILDSDGNPKPEPNLLKWAMWLEYSHLSPGKDNRIVERDYIGDVFVSTVFLGLDHDHSRKGPPVLWETMIFGGEHHQYMRRYTSRVDALAGHIEAVQLVTHSDEDIAELERMSGWETKR